MELEIEKRDVIKILLDKIDITNEDQLTSDMLKELQMHIAELILTDF